MSTRALGRLVPLAAAVVALHTTACVQDTLSPAGPPPELRGHAVALDVDLDSNLVRQVTLNPAALSGGAGGPNFALLGHNEVTATITNVTSSRSGGRTRIRFDLALTNNLSTADLVPATFPKPPTDQVVAFPFSTEPQSWWGGNVRTTSDWNGGSWNFFNDRHHCWGPSDDCFRWEPFGTEVAAGATTSARQVGFDVHEGARHFRVYIVVAADLRERSMPAGTGGVAGTVTSADRGALEGVQVSAGGLTASTGPTGLFTLSGLTPGQVSLTLANLPSGCSVPAPTNVTIVAGQVAQAAIAVDCPPAGAVEGQVVVNGGTGLPAVQVSIVGSALSVTTDVDGRFRFPSVPAGAQQVQVGGVPSSCNPPGAQGVMVPAAGVANVVISVPCQVAAAEKIVAVSTQTGNSELWVLNADGSNPTQLTSTTESELWPAWSAGAAKIAFIRRQGSGAAAKEKLFVVNPDGSGEQSLTAYLDDASWPTWSPDGQQIAFVCMMGGSFSNELCMVNADGSNLHVVQDPSGFGFLALQPDWDPTGNRVAYLNGSVANPAGDFWFVDGSGAPAGGVTTSLSFAVMPAWSPDGARIAFSRIVADGDLYIVDVNGGAAVNLTNSTGTENSPTWTRDGSSLIFEVAGDLFRMSVTGGAAMQLTSGGFYSNPHIR
jgi:hypothetical protein